LTKYKSSDTKLYHIINETNYNPALFAFYNIRPGNGVGLFSKKKTKKQIKNENTREKKASYKKQKEASIKGKQTHKV